METTRFDEPTSRKPLRLWPGVVIVVLQWLAWLVVPIVVPEAPLYGILGGLVGAMAVAAWWAFFSRAHRSERWGATVLVIVAMVATPCFLHESVAEGNMGFQFFLYVIPVLSLAFVVWAVASRRLPDGPRRAAMIATILLACGAFTLVRSKGITGDGAPEFAWRWAETPEERLLAQANDDPLANPPAPPVVATPEEPPPAQTGDDPVAPVSTPAAAERPTARHVAQPGAEPSSSPAGPDGSRDSSRMARPSRTRSRRHRPRRTDRDRLVSVATGRAVASAHWTGRFLLRGPRRPPLHPGAAR